MATDTNTAARTPAPNTPSTRGRPVMNSTTTMEVTAHQGWWAWFNEKILLGLGVRGYLRSLARPWSIIAAVILAVGIPVIVYRFAFGLGAVTNLSQIQPWGIWIGF